MAKRITLKMRDWRESRNLSQADAGALLDVSRRCWLKWENGVTVPGPELMRRLFVLTDGDLRPDDFYDLPRLPTPLRKAA